MKSDNLLVHDGRATGIDVQLVDENTVVYDLAPFLNHLGLLGWSPRGLPRRSLIARAATAFLAAYSAGAAWQLPIAWLRAYLLVQAATRDEGSTALRAFVGRAPAALELRSAVRALAAL
jgi:hypothetical protein